MADSNSTPPTQETNPPRAVVDDPGTSAESAGSQPESSNKLSNLISKIREKRNQQGADTKKPPEEANDPAKQQDPAGATAVAPQPVPASNEPKESKESKEPKEDPIAVCAPVLCAHTFIH